MPEIVEVELITRGVRELCLNKTIKSITYDVERCIKGSEKIDKTLGLSIKEVKRYGKSLLLDLGPKKILMHMMMSGQILFKDHPTPFTKHTRVIIGFTDDTELHFNDIRKFGYVSILEPEEVGTHHYLSSLGIDPLSASFTREAFLALTYKRKVKAKTFLLNQHLISGIGNIYADEILFCAGISPRRSLYYLSKPTLLKLYDCILEILHLSLSLGGSTRKDYLQVTGSRGHYLDDALVYNRTGEPCKKCGAPIQKIFFGGRGTHFCKSCQK